MQSIFEFLRADKSTEIPESMRAIYERSVENLRRKCIGLAPHRRPGAKPHGALNRTAARGLLVRDPADRIVPEALCPFEHMRLAAVAAFPPEHDLASTTPQDLIDAVRFTVKNRKRLTGWREGQKRALQEVAKDLEPLDAFIKNKAMPPDNVRILLEPLNVAFIAAQIDSIDWPDKDQALHLLRGMPVMGVIPDSNVFRPLAPVDREKFDAALSKILRSNDHWIDDLEARIKKQGRGANAVQKAGLRAVWQTTDNEVKKKLLHGPFTREDLDERFGKGEWRPMARFPVEQKGKTRAVDDAAASSSNEGSLVQETITLPSSDFPAEIAILIFQIADEMGVPFHELALGLSLDDIDAAYRRVATSQPQYTVVALWNTEKEMIEYYSVLGHNFGFVSAVTNFCRAPALQTAFARRYFALMLAFYIDDNINVDLMMAGHSGQQALTAQYSAAGWPLAPSKAQKLAPRNTELGVVCDMSAAHKEGIVSLLPTDGRMQSILDDLRGHKAENRLTPAEASRISGRLGFLFTTTYRKVGRAACQPLFQRVNRDKTFKFTKSLTHMLEFLEILLPLLPPKRVNVFPRDSPPGEHIIVYTDACAKKSFKGIGAVVIMPNGKKYYASLEVPGWILEGFDKRHKTLISQLELLAVIAANLTFAHLLTKQRVMYFEDNTTALSAMIYGYSSKEDMARLANMYHLQNFNLDIFAWHEWVPSKANIADIPSRPRFSPDSSADNWECLAGMEKVDMILPTREQWESLGKWQSDML